MRGLGRLLRDPQRGEAFCDALEHGIELRGLRHLEIIGAAAGAPAQQRLVPLDHTHRVDLKRLIHLGLDARVMANPELWHPERASWL